MLQEVRQKGWLDLWRIVTLVVDSAIDNRVLYYLWFSIANNAILASTRVSECQLRTSKGGITETRAMWVTYFLSLWTAIFGCLHCHWQRRLSVAVVMAIAISAIRTLRRWILSSTRSWLFSCERLVSFIRQLFPLDFISSTLISRKHHETKVLEKTRRQRC